MLTMKIFDSKHHPLYILLYLYRSMNKNWEVYSGVTKQKEMDKGLYRIFHSIETWEMWETFLILPGNKAHSTAYTYCTTRFEVTLLSILFYEQQEFWLLRAGEKICAALNPIKLI